MDNYTKIFRKILPIYWAFLTYMLLKPGTENQEYAFMFSGVDKILHFGIFFILGFLFLFAFPKVKILYYFSLLIFYGLLTEFLQYAMQVGRSAEFLDIVADIMGIALAYLLFKNKNYFL